MILKPLTPLQQAINFMKIRRLMLRIICNNTNTSATRKIPSLLICDRCLKRVADDLQQQLTIRQRFNNPLQRLQKFEETTWGEGLKMRLDEFPNASREIHQHVKTHWQIRQGSFYENIKSFSKKFFIFLKKLCQVFDWLFFSIPLCSWAENGTRTHDLLITNELLYQLSYFGNMLSKAMQI